MYVPRSTTPSPLKSPAYGLPLPKLICEIAFAVKFEPVDSANRHTPLL